MRASAPAPRKHVPIRKRQAIGRAVADARRRLARLARPAVEFDARRYFRGTGDLAFYNVGASTVRALAREIDGTHRGVWSIDDALAFADRLIVDRHLEVKGVGIELLARHRRAFTPRLLAAWKRWLAGGRAANWATTDAICGMLIGPLVLQFPALGTRLRAWARHPSLWVRRAAAVGLIPSVRRGLGLDLAYEIAGTLHRDREDLIQKAVGWLLREAGKRDAERLERHLYEHGPLIPRTTVRYAIERFPPSRRRRLLEITRTAAPDARAP